jgi:hypothetical protein
VSEIQLVFVWLTLVGVGNEVKVPAPLGSLLSICRLVDC